MYGKCYDPIFHDRIIFARTRFGLFNLGGQFADNNKIFEESLDLDNYRCGRGFKQMQIYTVVV